MEHTRREKLYARLPTPASADDLSDYDVVLHHSGRILTVAQAWHGPDGVVPRCVPGALPLSLLDGGHATDLKRPGGAMCSFSRTVGPTFSRISTRWWPWTSSAGSPGPIDHLGLWRGTWQIGTNQVFP